MTGVLDRKETLLAALHRMNDEVEAGLHVDPATGRHCAAFQASYARVVLELKQARALSRTRCSIVLLRSLSSLSSLLTHALVSVLKLARACFPESQPPVSLHHHLLSQAL